MRGDIPGHAEGDDFSDLCKDPSCPACSLWPAPGESDADWKARLRRIFDAAPLHNEDWRREQTA